MLTIATLPPISPPRCLAAELPDEPDLSFWVTNGEVYSILPTPDTVYIGGSFTYVGPNTGNGAPFDASTGQPLPSFPRAEGSVYACVPDGSGGWFIGGYFTEVAGQPRAGIARILSDLTLDPSFNPGAGGSVLALALSGDTLYAGGGIHLHRR